MSWRNEGWNPSDIRMRMITMAGAGYPSADYEISLVEAGADAMHKADVEWLEEQCTNRNHITHDMPRFECKACWQAFVLGLR